MINLIVIPEKGSEEVVIDFCTKENNSEMVKDIVRNDISDLYITDTTPEDDPGVQEPVKLLSRSDEDIKLYGISVSRDDNETSRMFFDKVVEECREFDNAGYTSQIRDKPVSISDKIRVTDTVTITRDPSCPSWLRYTSCVSMSSKDKSACNELSASIYIQIK